MKAIIFLIKSIILLILSIVFIIFINLVFFYNSINNNLGNVEFYERVLDSSITEELHQKFLDYVLEEAKNEVEFTQQEVIIIEKSLANTFTLDWFQKTLQLYFYDFQEYIIYGDLLVANVNLREEKGNLQNQIQKMIAEDFDSLSTEKQNTKILKILSALNIPDRLTTEDIIENHLPTNWQNEFAKIPSYQQTIVLGTYIGFGLFALMFYFLSGMIGLLRLFGLSMILAGGLNIGIVYYYGQEFLIKNIEKMTFSNHSAVELTNIVTQKSLVMPIIYVLVGIVFLIIAQKIDKIEKQDKQDEIEIIDDLENDIIKNKEEK